MVSINYFVEVRKQQKIALLKLHQESRNANDNQIKAVFSQNTGLSFRTIDVYMEELKAAELW